MENYHWVSPTDVDNFVQLPDVYVDLVDKEAMTVYYGDSVPTWDCISCKSTDYAIRCDVPMNAFFNMATMNWSYAMQRVCNYERITERDTLSLISGNLGISGYTRYICASMAYNDFYVPVDAGPGGYYPVVYDKALSQFMMTASSTFIHYKQAYSFFKNSIKVGSPLEGIGQVYAVYLDKNTGRSLPHTARASRCTVCNDDKHHCKCKNGGNYYRDSSTCHNPCIDNQEFRGNSCHPDASLNRYMGQVYRSAEYMHQDQVYDVYYTARIPIMLASGISYGRDIINRLTWQESPVRVICPWDTAPMVIDSSGESLIILDQSKSEYQFMDYTLDASRMMVMYTTCSGVLRLLYRSHDQLPTNDTGQACFIINASGPIPVNRVIDDMPQMYMPISMIFASEPYLDASGIWQIYSPDYPIPFRYDLANEPMRPMAHRLLQLASVYLFDDCGPSEMARFTHIKSDSSMLLDAIIGGLSMHMQRSSELRNLIIERLCGTLGVGIFDSLGTTSNGVAKLGKMKDILAQLDRPLCITTAVTAKFEVQSEYPEQLMFIIHRTPIIFCIMPTGTSNSSVQSYSGLF